MNETQRRAEKADLDQQTARRKQERAAQTKPLRKQYAITLRNADEAGLPEAMTVAQKPRPATVTSNAATDSNHEVEPDQDSEPDSTRDITLEETVRILGDYVTLSSASAKPNLAATLPSPITR